MKQSSTRCPEVRNGEIIPIITTTSVLVLATITATAATNTKRTDLKKTDKPNSGHTGKKTPRSP